jgi:hypothetical protein
MFDLDRFKGDCCAAATGGVAQQAIREIVARAVAAPRAVLETLGEPRRAEVQTLHRSADLTMALREVVWVNPGTFGYDGTVRLPAACR